MANWCWNWVTIDGEEENIKLFKEDLIQMESRYKKDNVGVRPEGGGDDLTAMFDISIHGDQFSFESRWVPGNDTLNYFAKKYDVILTNSYEESNDCTYGFWVGDKNSEKDIYLTTDEYLLAVKNGNDDTCIYNGSLYQSKEEALEEILQDKIKKIEAAE